MFTPATPKPTSRHRLDRARTRATIAVKPTTVLETPRQQRRRQRFPTWRREARTVPSTNYHQERTAITRLQAQILARRNEPKVTRTPPEPGIDNRGFTTHRVVLRCNPVFEVKKNRLGNNVFDLGTLEADSRVTFTKSCTSPAFVSHSPVQNFPL